MARKININWEKVRELGTKTKENISEFESARKNIQEITLSLNECWQGKDAENFRLSLFNYLESLKEDTEYLLKWESVLKKSANKYNDGVEEGLQRVRSLEEDFVLPNQASPNQISEVKFYE